MSTENVNINKFNNNSNQIHFGKVYDSNLYISNTDVKNYLATNFIPIAITSTLFAPLERTKTILQTMDLMSLRSSEKVYKFRLLFSRIIRDQGIFSVYRGNSANLFRYFFQSLSNIYIYQQINFLLFKNKKDLSSAEIIASSAISTFINVTFSHPFDLAHTRICGDMTRINFKRINSSVLEVFSRCFSDESSSNKNFSNLMKLYKGYSFALISNFLYWSITFCSFDKINRFVNKITSKQEIDNVYSDFGSKIAALFTGGALTTALASVFVYPFDTIKKKLQVNGGFGFEHKYSNGRECIMANLKDFKGLYRGFSVHLMKCIPFGFVHYSVLQRLSGDISNL